MDRIRPIQSKRQTDDHPYYKQNKTGGQGGFKGEIELTG
jgi:hypothetical protein